MRVIECNVCGETISAASDDELAGRLGTHLKEEHEQSDVEYDPEFTNADLAALDGEWGWFAEVVGPATAAGPGGLIDDDLAYVAPWGFDPAQLAAPVLVVHGGQDGIAPQAHAEWLAAWASGELLDGVNWGRRVVGAVGLVYVVFKVGAALGA